MSHVRSPLAAELARRVAGSPSLRMAVRRAVADEDGGRLQGLLGMLGIPASLAEIDGFLDAPGPFLPSVVGWT